MSHESVHSCPTGAAFEQLSNKIKVARDGLKAVIKHEENLKQVLQARVRASSKELVMCKSLLRREPVDLTLKVNRFKEAAEALQRTTAPFLTAALALV